MPRDREGSARRGPDAHDYWLAPLRRQFDNARWSVRRKPETAGGTTADPPQTDLRDGWSSLYRLRRDLQ